MGVKLRLTGLQHAEIKEHVIAPDGNEAGSLLFCEPVFRDGETILLLKQIEHVPYEACLKRTPVFLSWPTEHFLMRQYEYIENKGLSVIMLHSHPTGHDNFSAIDDDNDLKILPRLMACIDGEQPHGSAIMLPDGCIKGRIINDDNHFEPIEMISVCGDDLRFIGDFFSDKPSPSYVDKTAQVFGSRTTKILQNLKIGVVGCSGTGSPAVELLLRYHAGELVLIDFDDIEESNLNRMMASRTEDVKNHRLKVERIAEWIKETGLPTKVTAINDRIPSEATTKALSECDIIFGCVDNVIARHAMNKIACAYLIPYFDLGVAIKGNTSRSGDIRHAVARCHYLQPDKPCLLDRGAYSSERLAEEGYRQDDPEFYKNLKELGYTHEPNDIQAVMTLTMQAAILAVDDMMARIHGYRIEPNSNFDEQEHSFTHTCYRHKEHVGANKALRHFIAAGDKHVRM